MDIRKVKSIIIDEFSVVLKDHGFLVSNDDTGLSFFSAQNGKSHHIFFSTSDYGNKHNIYRPGSGIRFSKVEAIRAKALGQIDDKSIVTVRPYKEYNGDMDDVLPGPLDYVQTEGDVMKVVSILKDYVNLYILPFFDKYPTLKEVDAKIQQTPIVDLHKFIGQEVIGRRMAIMKLAGNSGYEEYVKMILAYFEQEARKENAEAKSDLIKYTRLKEYLTNH